MPLDPGREFVDGVIAYRSSIAVVPQSDQAAIAEVVQVLKTNHNRAVKVAAIASRQLGSHEETKSEISGGQGLILRVVYGEIMLRINRDGDKFVQLEQGSWAYIPPGVNFRLVGWTGYEKTSRFFRATLS